MIVVVVAICSYQILDSVWGNDDASLFGAMFFCVLAVAFLFPFGGNVALYDLLMKKQRAIKRIATLIVNECAYGPGGVKIDPELFEMSLREKSKREEMQALLDSLVAEKAREAADAFIEQKGAQTALQNMRRDLKNRIGWGSKTRNQIDTELEVVQRADEKATVAKVWFNRRRDVVRDAGFEVWDDFECYLALKIN